MKPDWHAERGTWVWLRSEWETKAVIFALAFLVYFWRRAPFLGQWDSFDYLKQIAAHQLSPLGFGRPYFVGYNFVLWELCRKLLRLHPAQIEYVVLGGIILLGSLGVIVFGGFAGRFLSPREGRMAMLALMLSPSYAAYSGSVMTEIPMLLALVAAAWALWDRDSSDWTVRDALGGVLWGIAIGIREQALVLLPAYLWILWVRRPGSRAGVRIRAIAVFALASAAAVIIPVTLLWLHDPAAFVSRIQAWFGAIPTARSHFRLNVQASLLWTFVACPASWLAVLGARFVSLRKPNSGSGLAFTAKETVAGVFFCLILPVAVLWRDADVQIHPRYLVIALPGALIICAALYRRWAPSRGALVVWAGLHVAVFGLAQVVLQPFREAQSEKRQYAQLVLDKVPGPALLIAGGNSAAFDYYRGIGVRPHWRVFWSGWDWDAAKLDGAVRESMRRSEPVYLCDGPWAWLNLEGERLELEYALRGYSRETAAPGLIEIKR